MEDYKTLELKVFTLPSCSVCPIAKQIASEVAQKFGLVYKEVNMNTVEGLDEGMSYQIMGAPSIVFNDEVIVRGRLVSRERLEEEVQKRLEKWRVRAAFSVKSQTP